PWRRQQVVRSCVIVRECPSSTTPSPSSTRGGQARPRLPKIASPVKCVPRAKAARRVSELVRSLTRNQVPRKGLWVRISCPPLVDGRRSVPNPLPLGSPLRDDQPHVDALAAAKADPAAAASDAHDLAGDFAAGVDLGRQLA